MGSPTSRWTKTSSMAELVFSQSTIEPVFNNTTRKLVLSHTYLESVSNHTTQEHYHSNQEHYHANQEHYHTNQEHYHANPQLNQDNQELNRSDFEFKYTYLDPVSNYTNPEPLPHHTNFYVFFYMCILMLVSNMATSTLRGYRRSLPFLRINQILLLNGYLVEVFNTFVTYLVISRG